MLPEHFTEEEWNKASDYLAQCELTTKTGGSSDYEVMKPYFDYLEKKGERAPVPAHNFQLMKEHGQKRYEQDLTAYIANRLNNGFKHTSKDEVNFRLLWLKGELRTAKERLAKAELVDVRPRYTTEDIKSNKAEQRDYKEYLKGEINTIKNKIQHSSYENEPTPTPPSHSQISLIRIYEQKPVSKINAQDIAIEYGHTTKNAGRVLLKKYDILDTDTSRLQFRDIELIKPQLSIEARERAERELNIVKKKRH